MTDSITETNFKNFLKDNDVKFPDTELKRIWGIIENELGNEVTKKVASRLTIDELKELRLPLGVARALVNFGKSPEPFQPLVTPEPQKIIDNCSEFLDINFVEQEEWDLDMLTPGSEFLKEIENEKNQTKIVCVMQKKGSNTREAWKLDTYFNAVKRNKSLTYSEFKKTRQNQLHGVTDFVKGAKSIFIRVINPPENAYEARIVEPVNKFNNCPEEDRISFMSNISADREFDFPKFYFTENTFSQEKRFYENIRLKIDLYDSAGTFISSVFSEPFKILAHQRQTALNCMELYANPALVKTGGYVTITCNITRSSDKPKNGCVFLDSTGESIDYIYYSNPVNQVVVTLKFSEPRDEKICIICAGGQKFRFAFEIVTPEEYDRIAEKIEMSRSDEDSLSCEFYKSFYQINANEV